MCVQLLNFACMNFAFRECDENEVHVILMCVHRDNEHYFITFILDLVTKNSKIYCECNADQPLSHALTSGHYVGVGHFLTEGKFIASKKYITMKKSFSQSLQEYQTQI